jgi:hypothetical protein
MQVSNFKIGKDIYGLLRPDKIVAYCKSFEELSCLANTLLPEIKEYPAQGVPFTAGFGDTGILSWGTDPPDEVQVSNEINRESWRLWVTNRLAVALLAARAATTDLEPWQFALERMRLEGVNTEKWIPSQTIWQR